MPITAICTDKLVVRKRSEICTSYTRVCPPEHVDNPRAISISYHPYQCRPCSVWKISRGAWLEGGLEAPRWRTISDSSRANRSLFVLFGVYLWRFGFCWAKPAVTEGVSVLTIYYNEKGHIFALATLATECRKFLPQCLCMISAWNSPRLPSWTCRSCSYIGVYFGGEKILFANIWMQVNRVHCDGWLRNLIFISCCN